MKIDHPYIYKLNEISNTAEEIKKIILSNYISKPVYNSHEFNKLMGISNATAKTWRRNGIIGHSVIGNKIYYTLENINELLNNHLKPIKKKD